jgi:hypothetical protein
VTDGENDAYFQLALIDSPFPTYIDVPEIDDDDDELAVELAKYYLEGCVDFHSAVRYGRRRCRVIINGAALISN